MPQEEDKSTEQNTRRSAVPRQQKKEKLILQFAKAISSERLTERKHSTDVSVCGTHTVVFVSLSIFSLL